MLQPAKVIKNQTPKLRDAAFDTPDYSPAAPMFPYFAPMFAAPASVFTGNDSVAQVKTRAFAP